MKTDMNKKLRFIINILYYGLAFATAYFFIKYVIVWCMPVLIGVAIAFFADRIAKSLCSKLPIRKRRIVSTLAVTVFWLIILFLCYILISYLIRELISLCNQFPQIIDSTENYFEELSVKFRDLKEYLPKSLTNFTEKLFVGLLETLGESIGKFLVFSANGATKLPSVFVFTATTILTSLLTLYNTDKIKDLLSKLLSSKGFDRLLQLKETALRSAVHMIKAELMLSGIVFVLIWIVLLIMNMPCSVLTALIITATDLLPILGINTVLFPWGIILILGGNTTQGLILIFSGLAISFIKSLLQPKLLGSASHTSTLALLLAGYFGFVLFGAVGALLSPMAVFLLSAATRQEHREKA